MKNLVLISVVLIPFLFACGECKKEKCNKEEKSEVKAPASVETKFASLYPDAEEVEWTIENGNYEADFELKEAEMSASFDSTGNFLESEVGIDISELPASITKFINDEISGVEISEAAKITDAKGVVTYEAEIKKDLIFTADGKMKFCCGSCKSKCSEAPEAVKSAFAAAYKDVEEVEWTKEDNEWEAEFEMNEIEMSANYDETGKLLETETGINEKDFLVAIKTYVEKNFAGKKIDEAAKIVDTEGKVSFEAEVEGTDYIFDKDGKFIKSKVEEKSTESKDPDDKD